MYQSSICLFIGKCAVTVRVQATRVASTRSYYVPVTNRIRSYSQLLWPSDCCGHVSAGKQGGAVGMIAREMLHTTQKQYDRSGSKTASACSCTSMQCLCKHGTRPRHESGLHTACMKFSRCLATALQSAKHLTRAFLLTSSVSMSVQLVQRVYSSLSLNSKLVAISSIAVCECDFAFMRPHAAMIWDGWQLPGSAATKSL